MTVARSISIRSISGMLALMAGLCLVSGLAPAQSKSSKAPARAAAKKQTKAAPNPADARYRRSSQSKPTAERYVEIERALADRGYLGSSADGKWDKESVDALKSFQKDQSLKNDGKLGALTLTALGLGPKRAPATVALGPTGSAAAPQVE